MARPSKTNIGTFPFDVDFFDNKYIVRIAGEYGVKGEIIAIKLLCAVYKNGYFMKWSIDERALMIRYLPGISPELLDQVINRLLKWGFFDESLFKSANILTSVEIQRNYFNAIKRRTGTRSISFPYLLLDPAHPNDMSSYKKNDENVTENEFLYTETGVSVYNNSNNGDKNPDNCCKNGDSCSKNPIEEHFEKLHGFLYTKTGVSVYKNSGLGAQKPDTCKYNNPDIVDKTGVSAYNNGVSVYNNSNNEDKKQVSDSNNPANIIYNINNSSSSSRNKGFSETFDSTFKEQKGKEEDYQNLDEALKEVKGRKVWRESVCKNHKITQQELGDLFEKFELHCKSYNYKHSSIQELISHFNKWIPFSKINQQNITDSENGINKKQKDPRSQRRGIPANSKKEKKYDAAFSTSLERRNSL